MTTKARGGSETSKQQGQRSERHGRRGSQIDLRVGEQVGKPQKAEAAPSKPSKKGLIIGAGVGAAGLAAGGIIATAVHQNSQEADPSKSSGSGIESIYTSIGLDITSPQQLLERNPDASAAVAAVLKISPETLAALSAECTETPFPYTSWGTANGNACYTHGETDPSTGQSRRDTAYYSEPDENGIRWAVELSTSTYDLGTQTGVSYADACSDGERRVAGAEFEDHRWIACADDYMSEATITDERGKLSETVIGVNGVVLRIQAGPVDESLGRNAQGAPYVAHGSSAAAGDIAGAFYGA